MYACMFVCMKFMYVLCVKICKHLELFKVGCTEMLISIINKKRCTAGGVYVPCIYTHAR